MSLPSIRVYKSHTQSCVVSLQAPGARVLPNKSATTCLDKTHTYILLHTRVNTARGENGMGKVAGRQRSLIKVLQRRKLEGCDNCLEVGQQRRKDKRWSRREGKQGTRRWRKVSLRLSLLLYWNVNECKEVSPLSISECVCVCVWWGEKVGRGVLATGSLVRSEQLQTRDSSNDFYNCPYNTLLATKCTLTGLWLIKLLWWWRTAWNLYDQDINYPVVERE